MLPHMYDIDWDKSAQPRENMLEEADIDNSSIEKILQNRFHHPLLSSEDEDAEHEPIDWDDIFKEAKYLKEQTPYVPGLYPTLRHPKLSALTKRQQFQILKVLCARNSHVLPQQPFQTPAYIDYRKFEALQEVYENEQREYIEWAKTVWVNKHCGRVLWLKPPVETTYEAEFKMRAHRLYGFPTNFDMGAQIPLECAKGYQYDVQLKEILVPVNPLHLPEVEVPKHLDRNTNIMRASLKPEPCQTHPREFILPNEDTVSMLSISEIHCELAQFAAEKGTRFIASENALRCLVQYNRHWTIPISVCQAITPDGERCNVVVLDSEFVNIIEPPIMRTYRAFKHLVEDVLVPHKDRERVKQKYLRKKEKVTVSKAADNAVPTTSNVAMGGQLLVNAEIASSDDDDDKICQQSTCTIAESVPSPKELELSGFDEQMNFVINNEDTNPAKPIEENISNVNDVASTASNEDMGIGDIATDAVNDIIGVCSRTCSGTSCETLPPRSFVKWAIKNCATAENLDVIIHCAHKARANDSSEIILEPMPEYQLELGGSEQSPDSVRRIVLALLLRQNASVINVRLDGAKGDMVRLDKYTAEQFLQQHNEKQQQVLNVLHSALIELQKLVPGHYVLQHEPAHGAKAVLCISRSGADGLQLVFDMVETFQVADNNARLLVHAPPTITPVLLPIHKHRKKLPCAFTTNKAMVIKKKNKRKRRAEASNQESDEQAEQPPEEDVMENENQEDEEEQ